MILPPPSSASLVAAGWPDEFRAVRYIRAEISPSEGGTLIAEFFRDHDMAETILLVLRWSARITGLLLLGLVVAIAIGHSGLPNVLGQPVPVQLEFFGLFLSLAGFLLGWRWEGLGGVLACSGFGVFCATELMVNGRPPGGAIPFLVLPAILFLASYGVDAALRRLRGTSG